MSWKRTKNTCIILWVRKTSRIALVIANARASRIFENSGIDRYDVCHGHKCGEPGSDLGGQSRSLDLLLLFRTLSLAQRWVNKGLHT